METAIVLGILKALLGMAAEEAKTHLEDLFAAIEAGEVTPERMTERLGTFLLDHLGGVPYEQGLQAQAQAETGDLYKGA